MQDHVELPIPWPSLSYVPGGMVECSFARNPLGSPTPIISRLGSFIRTLMTSKTARRRVSADHNPPPVPSQWKLTRFLLPFLF